MKFLRSPSFATVADALDWADANGIAMPVIARAPDGGLRAGGMTGALTAARSPSPRRHLSFVSLESRVAAYFGVWPSELRSASTRRGVTYARQVLMYLTRKLTRLSYPDIGCLLGGRNHSTVISGVRKIERLLVTDPDVAADVAALSAADETEAAAPACADAGLEANRRAA